MPRLGKDVRVPERSKPWSLSRKPLSRQPLSRQLRLLSSAAAIGVSLLVAGCSTGETAAPAVTTTPPSATPTPTGAAAPKPPPAFKPDLAASENQDYFDWVAAAVLTSDREAGGRAFIDALTVGGFDKSQMEVTFDRTAVDLEADSVQFSVRVHGECLIGQVGPASGGYRSIVAPMLGSGTCLVGATRQIDW